MLHNEDICLKNTEGTWVWCSFWFTVCSKKYFFMSEIPEASIFIISWRCMRNDSWHIHKRTGSTADVRMKLDLKLDFQQLEQMVCLFNWSLLPQNIVWVESSGNHTVKPQHGTYCIDVWLSFIRLSCSVHRIIKINIILIGEVLN